jgi:hypothetical protein
MKRSLGGDPGRMNAWKIVGLTPRFALASRFFKPRPCNAQEGRRNGGESADVCLNKTLLLLQISGSTVLFPRFDAFMVGP